MLQAGGSISGKSEISRSFERYTWKRALPPSRRYPYLPYRPAERIHYLGPCMTPDGIWVKDHATISVVEMVIGRILQSDILPSARRLLLRQSFNRERARGTNLQQEETEWH
jgi:hypothetical protein